MSEMLALARLIGGIDGDEWGELTAGYRYDCRRAAQTIIDAGWMSPDKARVLLRTLEVSNGVLAHFLESRETS